MALEMYTDDAMTNVLKQMERFDGPGSVFTLAALSGLDVEGIYKFNAGVYTLLTTPAGYTITGDVITLVASLTASQHILTMPADKLNIVFTGLEGSLRTQTKKVVFHKTGAFIYDGLKLYSEDFTVPPYEFIDTSIGNGFMQTTLTGVGIYDKNGIELTDANAVGLLLFAGTIEPDMTYTWPNVAVIVNGEFIGEVIGSNIDIVALPLGTVIPMPTYATDITEILSTGDLKFAIDTNGTIPADEAFKHMLIVPTLTAAAPTQKVWVRETATIPSITTDIPNLPFKLAGQEYPE